MKGFIITLGFSLLFMQAYAQQDTLFSNKPLKVWVYGSDGKVTQGILAGTHKNTLLLRNAGSNASDISADKAGMLSIPYTEIETIKTRKRFGWLKGMGYGGAIGLAPIVAGEGGAYVALVAFPLGLATGALLGNSKKKHRINKNLELFENFSQNIRRG